MESSFAFKVQLGDKIKMLAGNSFASIEELRKAAKSSYPKRLADKDINLKYADEDGDWLYLSEDDGLQALKQHAASLKGKKVKLVIDVVQNKGAKKVEGTNVEEVREALATTSLEDREEDIKEEVKFEDLKDFKLADVAAEIESLLNSEDKVRPGQLFKALRKATEGTKAEPHIKRFLGKMRGHGGRKHDFRKMMKRCHEARSCSIDKSSSPEGCPVFPGQGAEGFGPFGGFGPMGHPFAHGPHFGPYGGFGPAHHGDRRAMKFFRKFMKSYRSSSSSSSSSEERKKRRQEKRAQKMCGNKEKKQEHMKKRPIISQNPTEAITGKAGETVNVS